MSVADLYREWSPPAAWCGVAACCWVQQVGADRVQRVLPDGHADLLVRDDTIEVVGVHDEVDLPVLAAGTRLHGIRLRPHAVAAAFRLDASTLRNRTVPLEDVVGARAARRLLDPAHRDAWLRAIAPDRRTAHAVDLLARMRPVDDVAGALGVTARQLRRLVVAEVGLPPKALQRVLRLQRFITAAERIDGLASAAAAAGYADQSHLTREVRALAGVTPAHLLRERAGTVT